MPARAMKPGHTGWIATMAIGLFLVLVLLGNMLLNDPDTQWHIAVGRHVWSTASWPRTDLFSHTFAGQPWAANVWLSQVLLHLAHELGGWNGVVALAALAVALAMAMMTRSFSHVMALSLALILTLVVFGCIAQVLVARPHVLALPAMTGWVCALIAAHQRGGQPPWAALPLMVLWANLHAGFSIGLVIAAAFALEQLLRCPREQWPGTVVRWGAFGPLSVAAGLATPYGLEALWVTLKLGGAESLQYIQEWQPLPAEAKSVGLIMLAALMVFAMARYWRTHVARLLLALLLTWMMLRHQRFVVLFAIVVPLICAQPLAALLQEIGRRFNLFQGADPLAGSPRWRIAAPLLAAMAGLALVFIPLRTSPTKTPMAALASVPEPLQAQPVFNSYDFGGFLMFRNIKTFIDGRTDQLFLDGFMNRMNRAIESPQPDDLSAMLDQYRVAWALVETGSDEDHQLMRMTNWKLHHADAIASVYIRQP